MPNIVRVIVAVSALSPFCTVRPASAYVGCEYCTFSYQLRQISCDAQEYACDLTGAGAGSGAGAGVASLMKTSSGLVKGAVGGVVGAVVARTARLACYWAVGDCRSQAEEINRNCVDLYCRPVTDPLPTYGTEDPAHP